MKVRQSWRGAAGADFLGLLAAGFITAPGCLPPAVLTGPAVACRPRECAGGSCFVTTWAL
jgi:hypothetical protein